MDGQNVYVRDAAWLDGWKKAFESPDWSKDNDYAPGFGLAYSGHYDYQENCLD
jgi:hypothetical protein